MAQGGSREGSGRPKGSKKMYDAALFVARIERTLKGKGNPHGLQSVAESLLTCGEPRIVADVWKLLMMYKFGKPKESVEHTGPDGKAIEVVIRRAS